MGEVISLSQYRKDRIREASRGKSATSKIRYGLAKPKPADLKDVGANTEGTGVNFEDVQVRQLAEIRREEIDPSGDKPERV